MSALTQMPAFTRWFAHACNEFPPAHTTKNVKREAVDEQLNRFRMT